MPHPPSPQAHPLSRLLEDRIVILDGAMGTNIQRFKPSEADYRGSRFAHNQRDLLNNNEILSLTQPRIIADIHARFAQAGADILETNTFSATSIAQADFFRPEPAHGQRKDQDFFADTLSDPALDQLIADLNHASVQLARQAADAATAADSRPRYVAGAIGPMPVTASLSPDVNDPGFRQVSFDQLRSSYRRQIDTLIEAGADLLLVETIFDTLNAKAALFAAEEAFEQAGRRLPVMVSFTITDLAGRTLSGQTVEAFWASIAHAKPFSVGINCALGADAMRPFAEELAHIATVPISIYANAGLPNPLSETGYDQTPEDMRRLMADYAKAGFLNIVGGCCGTTPEHIAAIAQGVQDLKPRPLP
jgi:5-methyltetrahydrofolate--homocysteine methyltransferase